MRGEIFFINDQDTEADSRDTDGVAAGAYERMGERRPKIREEDFTSFLKLLCCNQVTHDQTFQACLTLMTHHVAEESTSLGLTAMKAGNLVKFCSVHTSWKAVRGS